MDTIHSGYPPRARAELWQCLAQSLLPPRGEVFPQALRQDLAPDLEELSSKLGLNIDDAVNKLSVTLSQTDEKSLLPTYSTLFLVPPIPAMLNIGVYLDGTLLGPNAKILTEIFYRHGVEQSPIMHDTPDHFATAMEFMAFLFHKAEGAEPAMLEPMLDDMETVRGLLWHTLPELHRRVTETEQERALPTVYSMLLQIVKTVLRDEQGIFFYSTGNDRHKTARRYFTKRETAADLVPCKACGKAVSTARELKVIIDRLIQSGLPTDHLKLCPDCRDGTRGWKAGNTDFNLPGFR